MFQAQALYIIIFSLKVKPQNQRQRLGEKITSLLTTGLGCIDIDVLRNSILKFSLVFITSQSEIYIQKNLGQRKFWMQKIMVKKYLGPKSFVSKQNLCSNKMWVQMYFGSNTYLSYRVSQKKHNIRILCSFCLISQATISL